MVLVLVDGGDARVRTLSAKEELVERVARVHEGVVSAEERPEDLERVHRVEGEGPVEARRRSRSPGGLAAVGPASPAAAAAAAGPQPVLAVAVVGAPLVLVTEHLVCLRDLLEPLLRVVGLVLVRVELERHFPVGLLDILLGRAGLHAQHAVVILSHDHFTSAADYRQLVIVSYAALDHKRSGRKKKCTYTM